MHIKDRTGPMGLEDGCYKTVFLSTPPKCTSCLNNRWSHSLKQRD